MSVIEIADDIEDAKTGYVHGEISRKQEIIAYIHVNKIYKTSGMIFHRMRRKDVSSLQMNYLRSTHFVKDKFLPVILSILSPYPG